MKLTACAWGLAALACLSAQPQGAGPQAASREPKAISIRDFRFTPAELTVSIGDSVAWTNGDALLHTATADSGAWSSPELGSGSRFVFVPNRAGRYPYHCAAHPVMRGMLIVRE